jgi:PAS domain S-box-containing protein
MNSPLRILMLEDCESDAELVLNQLRQAGIRYECERVDSKADFLARLETGPGLILSDYHLPQFDGLKALDLVRQRGLDTPFIIISGTISEEMAINALRGGADDYVLKDRPARLSEAVRQALERRRLRTEREQQAQALHLSARRLAAVFKCSPVAIGINTLHSGRILEVNDRFTEMFGYTCAEAVDRTIFDLKLWADPSARAPVIEALQRDGLVRSVEGRLRTRSGDELDVLMSFALTQLPGEAEPVVIVMVSDLTDRKRAEASLEHFNEQLQQLAHAVERQTSARKLDDVFAVARTSARSIIGADGVTIVLRDGDRCHYVDEDAISPLWKGKRFPMHSCISGWVMLHGEPAVIEDIYADSRIPVEAYRPTFVKSLAMLPLRVTETFGAIGCYWARQHQATGQEMRILALLADVTARAIESVRAYEELAKNQALLNMASHLSSLGAWSVDLPERKLTWSEEVRSIHEVAPDFTPAVDEAINFYAPESRPVIREVFDACATEGTPFDVELPMITAKGCRIWVRAMGEAVRDAEGNIIRVQGAVQNITTRKQADEKIREQAALLDAAHEAICVKDLDERILYWNKGAERMFGWRASEALGRNAVELLYGDRNTTAYHKAKGVLMERGEWQGELRKRTKDGRDLTVEVRWTLMRDAQNRPRTILAIDTDVSEKRSLEAQVLRSQRVESLGTLASGIAHDLNNILAPILMSSTMLAEMIRDDAESAAMIGTINSSAQRGADIVKQILTFARGVQGERIPIHPQQLAKDVLKMARETFPRAITIRADLPKDLWPVTGDATQLHQVLLNLFVNARDAIGHSGTIKLSAENVMMDDGLAASHPGVKPGPHVKFEVSDTGSGIPPEIVEKIFDPFFTTKEPGKGTGLGLSTVIGIVKSHNGCVTVYSERGKGTKFHVYLPATPTEATDAVADQREKLPRGQGQLVLVVDDEEPIRKVVDRMLTRHGYRVVTAADGAEGMAVFAQHRDEVRVVLTDLMMPNLDGVSLVRALRKVNSKVPVIAASGLGSGTTPGREDELKALGVEHRLGKPYSVGKPAPARETERDS